jgi:Xaa-Pro aminopeptidase
MKKTAFLVIFFFTQSAFGQENNPFRYDTDFIPYSFYQNIRNEFRSMLSENSVAVIFAAPVKNRSNDTYHPYHQNTNFYYLTGFTEPNSVVFIFKNPVDFLGVKTNEILFVMPRKKEKEIWTGRIAGIDEAKKISGIETVLNSFEFENFAIDFSGFEKILLLNFPSGLMDDRNDSCDLYDLVEITKKKIGHPSSNSDFFLLQNILKRMREVKKQEELTLMKKAIDITCEGHIEMMRSLKPGMFEYQVRSSGEYVFMNYGAEALGYNSICGGGENSIILHYEGARKQLNDGELLLLDMGAEYHGYTADVTRTLPVNGTYNPEQKIIYDLVLKARDSAIAQCLPGNSFRDPHNAAVSVIKDGLLKNGIINDLEEWKNYFMHGTSHYLGLDVHDPGTFNKLKAGNVITVEPGIYIAKGSKCDPKWWNIGIRIEDDLLITESGYTNLSAKCPVTTSDIESIMKQEPVLTKPEK